MRTLDISYSSFSATDQHPQHALFPTETRNRSFLHGDGADEVRLALYFGHQNPVRSTVADEEGAFICQSFPSVLGSGVRSWQQVMRAHLDAEKGELGPVEIAVLDHTK